MLTGPFNLQDGPQTGTKKDISLKPFDRCFYKGVISVVHLVTSICTMHSYLHLMNI